MPWAAKRGTFAEWVAPVPVRGAQRNLLPRRLQGNLLELVRRQGAAYGRR